MEHEQEPVEIKMAPEPAAEAEFVKPPEEREALAVTPEKVPAWRRGWNWYIERKKWSIAASVLLLLLVLAVIPWSRYHAAALVIKKDITVEIKDSKTHTPVSGATLAYAGQSISTNAEGKAVIPKLKAGHHTVTISKKYYKDQVADVLSPILSPKSAPSFNLVATGRQVSVHITDYVDGKGIAGATIVVADTNAKTDSTGAATLVVPADLPQQKAKVTLKGYNDAEFTVNGESDQKEPTQVKLVPSGKIYFFSNRTGKLDLMKVNLDGSGTETVLAGTGFEQVNSSSISQSPDWRYVALVVKRSSADTTPQLYILSTNDDRLLGVDSGKANFALQGWAGNTLIYTVSRTDIPDTQTGKNKLKSYDATTGKITQLDQTKGTVADDGSTAFETYAASMVFGNTVVYAKNWTISGSGSGEEHTLNAIDVDGQNYKKVASYSALDKIYYSQHKANSFYILQQPGSGGTDSYFEYVVNSTPKQVNLDTNQFYAGSQGYYPSPSGKSILWTEQRDGKNTFLIGDSNGGNGQSVGSFSDYLPFGWYTDRYLILTKSANELYLMSAHGGTPVKISDYQYTNYYY
jgi:hypothetical protein